MKLEDMRKIAAARTPGRWHIGHISEIHKDAADIDSADGAIADNIYGSGNQTFIIVANATYDKLLAVAEAAKGLHKDGYRPYPGLVALRKLEKALEALEAE